MDLGQVLALDERDHDALARLLDGQAIGHQLQHGLAHRAARDVQLPRKFRHAQLRSGPQVAGEDGIAQRRMHPIDDAADQLDLRQPRRDRVVRPDLRRFDLSAHLPHLR